MIARLLDSAPVGDLEEAAKDRSGYRCYIRRHELSACGFVPGWTRQGAIPADRVGNGWTAEYIVASGNKSFS